MKWNKWNLHKNTHLLNIQFYKYKESFLWYFCSLHQHHILHYCSNIHQYLFNDFIFSFLLFQFQKKKIITITNDTSSWIFWFTSASKTSDCICTNCIGMTSSMICWAFINIYFSFLFIYHLQNGNSNKQKQIKPWQKVPFPEYPILHVQLKLPGILVHVALAWQLWVPKVHSLISNISYFLLL